MRDLLEDTIVDGVDSLSKEAMLILFKRIGLIDRLPFEIIIGKKVSDLEMFKVNEKEKKTINKVVKIWNYFGP